jgi:hypothetical protein
MALCALLQLSFQRYSPSYSEFWPLIPEFYIRGKL